MMVDVNEPPSVFDYPANPGTQHPDEVGLTHYTTGPGLIGIFDSKAIWASDLRHLNDSSEFTFTFKTAAYSLQSTPALYQPGGWVEKYPGLADRIRRSADQAWTGSFFVTSFSTKQSDLSQFRGYTTPGNAYTITFHARELERRAKSLGWRLERVWYGTDASERIAELVIGAFAKLDNGDYSTHGGEDAVSEAAWQDLFLGLAMVAPTFKDAAFADEHEWRLISPPSYFWSLPEPPTDTAPMTDQRLPVLWRAGPTFLIPYTKFPIGDPPGFGKDSSLVKFCAVGPGPHMVFATSSLLNFMTSMGYPSVAGQNGIPYRG